MRKKRCHCEQVNGRHCHNNITNIEINSKQTHSLRIIFFYIKMSIPCPETSNTEIIESSEGDSLWNPELDFAMQLCNKCMKLGQFQTTQWVCNNGERYGRLARESLQTNAKWTNFLFNSVADWCYYSFESH